MHGVSSRRCEGRGVGLDAIRKSGTSGNMRGARRGGGAGSRATTPARDRRYSWLRHIRMTWWLRVVAGASLTSGGGPVLPAVLPSVSGTASRFLTRCDPMVREVNSIEAVF